MGSVGTDGRHIHNFSETRSLRWTDIAHQTNGAWHGNMSLHQRARLQFTNLVAGNSFSRSHAHLRFSEQPAQMSCEHPQHSTCSLTGLDASQVKQWNVAVCVCVRICCSVVISVSQLLQESFCGKLAFSKYAFHFPVFRITQLRGLGHRWRLLLHLYALAFCRAHDHQPR